MNFARETIVRLARRFDGVPYLYAANGPLAFDCSGYVRFLLQVVDLLPQQGDWTADQLARMFEPTLNPEPGDLAVYGTEHKVTHIMVVTGHGSQVIGAHGGDSRTRTLQDALHRRARVSLERADYRSDLLGYRCIATRTSPAASDRNAGGAT